METIKYVNFFLFKNIRFDPGNLYIRINEIALGWSKSNSTIKNYIIERVENSEMNEEHFSLNLQLYVINIRSLRKFSYSNEFT